MQDEKEKLEMRMKCEEERYMKEKKELVAMLEAKDKEMETRLEELEDKMKQEKVELERGLKASISELGMEVESLRKEMASNISNIALTNPSLRDLPIVIISAWRSAPVTSPQTVTFESFLANFNNADRPGGGDGVLDLDSGIFTCFTPGFYTVSFSAFGSAGDGYGSQQLFLYKNGSQLPETYWKFAHIGTATGYTSVISSRIVVSWKYLHESCQM